MQTLSAAGELPLSQTSSEGFGPGSCYESVSCAPDDDAPYIAHSYEANSRRRRGDDSRKRVWTASEDARLAQLVQVQPSLLADCIGHDAASWCIPKSPADHKWPAATERAREVRLRLSCA